MRMTGLAYKNFKSSLRSYLALIFSQAFTIMIFYHFQNIIYSDAFSVLKGFNARNIKSIVEVFSFVLGCFMLFFIGYSTNVFLTRQKKEIGIYVFMGLSNQKIGGLYMLETAFTGMASFLLGIVLGILTTALFQMILLAMTEIAVSIRFWPSLEPVINTAIVYFLIYLLFAFKGYVNIVRSSVLNLVMAAKKNEYVGQKKWILLLKAVMGVGALGFGYYLAVKEGGQEVMAYVFAAVVFVTVGVYLLFGGLLPVIFQGLAANKVFLYEKQRNLWINNVVFRIRKNYRTYAMMCVLILCAATALATGFAMKYRYENIVNSHDIYTFQFLTVDQKLEERARETIQKIDPIAYHSQIQVVFFEDSPYGVLAYGQVERLAHEIGIEFSLPEPADQETILLTFMNLMSLLNIQERILVKVHDREYEQIAETRLPFLGGALQEKISFYLVSDREYERLSSLGQEFYLYSYKLEDLENFARVEEATRELSSIEEESYTGRISTDPQKIREEIEWVKILYALSIFMFMVFVVAGGCIMFMRVYNDAYEDTERYRVLQKLGYDSGVLKKSIICELGVSYVLPFLIMAMSSRFSVHALEKMMYADLLQINVASVIIVLIVFLVFYGLSVMSYCKNVRLV